jgi:hypothetical protein
MKKTTETEYGNFTDLVDRVLSVPHSEIQRRVEAHRKAAAKNPHRRGPKSKKRHASRVVDAKS